MTLTKTRTVGRRTEYDGKTFMTYEEMNDNLTSHWILYKAEDTDSCLDGYVLATILDDGTYTEREELENYAMEIGLDVIRVGYGAEKGQRLYDI